ncbi:MAG TPA: glycosyltransferase family 4 protein [Roseiarcus sp.]|jgi:glycosyltransferase involved in cell wall biosynthesis
MNPRLLYVVSEDWAFLSHRLPMARAARAAGFAVHVATRIDRCGSKIEAEGFATHHIPFSRGRISPLATLHTIRSLTQIIAAVRPHVTHHSALQPSILGSIAAIGTHSTCLNAINGLGFAFTSETAKARLLRPVLGVAIRLLVNRARARTLVQNPDDRAALIRLGVSSGSIALIPGSGVDVEALTPLPEPDGPLTIGFAGRLLDDKGVRPLVQAVRSMRAKGANVVLLIAGTPDPANPSSIPLAEIEGWREAGAIEWLGQVSDIRDLWRRCHIAALPSRREGLPKALLEAAACGRAMIATDVPGCREVAIEGETGLLVPMDDAGALADAIERLDKSPGLRRAFAARARVLAETRFAETIIERDIGRLYREMLATTALRD